MFKKIMLIGMVLVFFLSIPLSFSYSASDTYDVSVMPNKDNIFYSQYLEAREMSVLSNRYVFCQELSGIKYYSLYTSDYPLKKVGSSFVFVIPSNHHNRMSNFNFITESNYNPMYGDSLYKKTDQKT